MVKVEKQEIDEDDERLKAILSRYEMQTIGGSSTESKENKVEDKHEGFVEIERNE